MIATSKVRGSSLQVPEKEKINVKGSLNVTKGNWTQKVSPLGCLRLEGRFLSRGAYQS